MVNRPARHRPRRTADRNAPGEDHLVKELSELVAKAVGDPSLVERTWVAMTEAVPGGWGIGGHCYTNEEIIQHVRELLGKA